MPDQIRIVFLIGQLGLGGSERQLSLLLENFDRRRFDITVVVFNPSPYLVLDDQLRQHGVKVVHAPSNENSMIGRSRFLYVLFRQIRPHLIQSWTVHDNPYAGLIGRLAGVRQRWGALRGSLHLRGFRSMAPVLRWLSLHTTPRMVVNAASLQQELQDSGIPRDRILLLPNCTRLDEPPVFANFENLGLKSEGPVIGAVGNLRRVKNHMLFIEALALVRDRVPDVGALIAGQPIPNEADLPGLLKERIRSLGLEGQVVLAGFQENIPGLMRRLDVFCLTSDSEGAPNVLLEAMAASRPVVATRVGGVPDIVLDGETGYLVEPGKAEPLAEAILALLSDPARREIFGQRARRRVVKCFGCRQATAKLEAAYIRALGISVGG